MSWIKEANKLGRIAVNKSGQRIEGEKWLVVGKIDMLNIERHFF